MPETPPARRRRDLPTPPAHEIPLTDRQAEILRFIEHTVGDRGYPPSVREIGSAVGLTSPSTVHSHIETLQRLGYLRKDPSKPRAIEVRWDAASGSTGERRPVRHVPLLGDVAAGTGVIAQENVEELVPLPTDLTGDGELFMLRVRGDSMIDLGIFPGDFVVVRSQTTADNDDVVVAGIPGEEATVKSYHRKGSTITLIPHNPKLSPMEFNADEVVVYGKVVTVLRKL
jgi:repressor LexA